MMSIAGRQNDDAESGASQGIIQFCQSTRPMLSVAIHTEMRFDWSAPFDRRTKSVEHLAHIGRIQRLFDLYGICPTYVVDYSVASQAMGVDALAPIINEGRAEIGAHLHPWVCPPFEEKISSFNSFPGNLSAEIERRKIEVLTDQIERSFGTRPQAYLAGRYGFGPNTGPILKDLGYDIDMSASPPFDYSFEGGPDYSKMSCHPRWLDDDQKLLGLCASGAFTGFMRRYGGELHSRLDYGLCKSLRLQSVLAKTHLFERIRLSPEGYVLSDMIRLCKQLHRDGIRYFLLSFHSPSIEPGNTDYVRTNAELELFLNSCSLFFEFFFGNFGGVPVTPRELLTKARSQS